MTKLLLKAVALCAVLSAFGCASPSKMLVNNEGKTVRCAASGWGWAGAPLANSAFDRCVGDYNSLGYMDLSDAGYVGIQLDIVETKNARVLLIRASSPAQKAGIRIDDQIVEVNGQAVSNPVVAKQLMFGKTGEFVSLKVKRGKQVMAYTLVREPLTEALRTPASK